MTRIRGGGFALELRGAVGPVALQRHRGGTLSAHPRTVPANPRTASQASVRRVYAWLAAYVAARGNRLEAPIKIYAEWKATTKLGPLVADNVKLLKGASDLAAFIPHRASFGVPSFTSLAVTALSGKLVLHAGATGGANGYSSVQHVFAVLRDQDPHDAYLNDVASAEVSPVLFAHEFTGLTSGQPYFCWAYPMMTNPKGRAGFGAPLTAMGTPL